MIQDKSFVLIKYRRTILEKIIANIPQFNFCVLLQSRENLATLNEEIYFFRILDKLYLTWELAASNVRTPYPTFVFCNLRNLVQVTFNDSV